jgi:nanoRNase/pAp phosphatase (c-di-AMP/oligoRNAs hydrolase)
MWEELNKIIQDGKRFVVASHRNTDGDAVGSLMAFHEYLTRLGKQTLVLNPDPVPTPYHFLDPDDVIQVYDAEKHRDAVLASDTWLCLDLNAPKRMTALGDLVPQFEGTLVCIDHHLAAEPFAHLMLTDEQSSSTGFMIGQFLEWTGVEWTESLATAIYAAMASDTGNFRFTNTDGVTLRMAAGMVERGAKPADVYRQLYEGWSWGRMRLFRRVLRKIEFHADGRLAMMSASREDLAATGCVPVDLEDFVNYGRMIRGVDVSALVCELAERECKASIRSAGRVDVAEVAQALGGGGHRNAAGVRFDLPLGEGKERLRHALEQAIQNSCNPAS